jgi:arsenite methyltransferase
MADLSTPETSSSCCARVERATCCEPAGNGACCETSAAGGSCGCAAGQSVEAGIRETVRARYAAAATAVAESTQSGCCGAPDVIAGCGPDITSTDKHGNEVFGATLYDDADDPALKPAVEASLGCGVPTAVADLHDGETGSTSAPAPAPTC